MKKTLFFTFLLISITAINAAETNAAESRKHKKIIEPAKQELTPLETRIHMPISAVQFNECEARYKPLDPEMVLSQDVIEAIELTIRLLKKPLGDFHAYLEPDMVTFTPKTAADTPTGTTSPATDNVGIDYITFKSSNLKLSPDARKKLYEFTALACLQQALEEPFDIENLQKLEKVLTKEQLNAKKEHSSKINEIVVKCQTLRILPRKIIIEHARKQVAAQYASSLLQIQSTLRDAGYIQREAIE